MIPSLNQGDFLKRCIESCLQQTVSNREVLIQDGGSTDSTVEILKTYNHEIDWISETDDGQADAVNRCVGRAKGEIIAWINSDDYYFSADSLEKVCKIFWEQPDIDIVFGDAVMVDVNGIPNQLYSTASVIDPQGKLMETPASPLSQPATFFRKSLFDKVGGLKTNLHWALDLDLWIRMFDQTSRWQRIDSVLASMTVHEDAKSIAGMGKQIRELTQIKLDYLRQQGGSKLMAQTKVRWNWIWLQIYRFAKSAGWTRTTEGRTLKKYATDSFPVLP